MGAAGASVAEQETLYTACAPGPEPLDGRYEARLTGEAIALACPTIRWEIPGTGIVRCIEAD